MQPAFHLLTSVRICIDQEEYARRRRPFFIRYIDCQFRFKHRRVESYAFVQDCVLEVTFLTDTAEDLFVTQMPLVCFDPNDDGRKADEDDPDAPFRSAYRRRSKDIARIRDELDQHFPECEQEGTGYLDDDCRMFMVMHLLPDFRVVISTSAMDDSTPDIFRWYTPVQVGAPPPPDVRTVQFFSVAGVVSYADRIFPGQRRRVPRCTAEEARV